jgi:hypothetical protein
MSIVITQSSVSFNVTLKYKRKTLKLKNLQTYDDLVSGVQLNWKAFRIMEFQIIWKNPISDADEIIADDTHLIRFYNKNVCFRLKSCCVGFSDYANKKAAALDAVGAKFVDPSLIPTDDNAFPQCKETIIAVEAAKLQNELLRRARSINLEEASEYTKREFISPFLIAAICICNLECRLVSMICEKPVVGKHGRGPIDYAILFKRIFILLTEAKNTDLEGGQSQNIVQQESCRESLANAYVSPNMIGASRKRKYDEIYNVVRAIPTFGIVTTARQWRFTQVDHSKEMAVVKKSSTFDLLLDPKPETAQLTTQLQNITEILCRIVGILKLQMKHVLENDQVQSLMDSMDARTVHSIESTFDSLAKEMEDEEDDEDKNSQNDENDANVEL